VCAIAVSVAIYAGAATASSDALPSQRNSMSAVRIVQAVLATPDDEIDFAKAKLTFDKLVDPSVDMKADLKRIDQMVATIKTMAGPSASSRQKLIAIRKYIYESGDWNWHRPYQYDLTDPLGTKIANKLLSTYIATRRGNCVSMPVLFVVLADRMGLHATLSLAPFHVFVKYADDVTGTVFNLETTSGAFPARDIWLRQNFPMTDHAIANGIYLRALTKREILAVMAEEVLENDFAQKRYREAIDVADVILKSYPNFVDAMLMQGSAYAHLMDKEFKQKYPSPIDIPLKLIPVYEIYAQKNELLFDRAEALGWREADGQVAQSKGQ